MIQFPRWNRIMMSNSGEKNILKVWETLDLHYFIHLQTLTKLIDHKLLIWKKIKPKQEKVKKNSV